MPYVLTCIMRHDCVGGCIADSHDSYSNPLLKNPSMFKGRVLLYFLLFAGLSNLIVSGHRGFHSSLSGRV